MNSDIPSEKNLTSTYIKPTPMMKLYQRPPEDTEKQKEQLMTSRMLLETTVVPDTKGCL